MSARSPSEAVPVTEAAGTDSRPPLLRRERHYGDRIVRCFVHRPPTVDSLLKDAVARGPERIALSCGARRLTYGDLDRLVDAVAANLAGRGVSKGDRIAFCWAITSSSCSP